MHLALYGHVKMMRGECPNCGSMALIVRGAYQCCDYPASEPTGPVKQKRIVESDPHYRKQPNEETKRKLLEEQDRRCFYCLRSFGSFVWIKKRMRRLKINWDHALPLIYSGDNSSGNFVAACHVCNSLKSDLIFRTIEEARTYLQDAWDRKYPRLASESEED